MKKGLLLLNLGTPSSTSFYQVSLYLQEFLCDPRVVDLPFIFRYCLFFIVILPFRIHQTLKAYQRIWTSNGSPLLFHSLALRDALKNKLKGSHHVELGMRYGTPPLREALHTLSDCDELTILPLYPQYASASTGSSLEAVFNALRKQKNIPSLRVIHEFYEHPTYIQAQAAQIKPYLFEHDFVLFSYHGLPERQVLQSGCKAICKTACPSSASSFCYRASCFRASARLAESLQLPPSQFDTSFQSRLGRIPWIQPYTEAHLSTLAERGIKRLLIACPSFVTDCLETLDEIEHLAKEKWLSLGGETLTLVPSLNSSDHWVDAIVQIIK